MSVVSKSKLPASIVVAFRPAAQNGEPGWQALGGVASSILADLDRRRRQGAQAPAPEVGTKAA
jgi:hypothetical protein